MRTRRRRCPTHIEPLESRLLMAVISVLNNNDSGAGSLRQAIAAAVDGDTIDLTARTGTIYFDSGQITLDKDLTIVGPGATRLALRGWGSRLFSVAAGANVTIADVEMENGSGAATGGAIFSEGNLTVRRVLMESNVAAGAGGGIYQVGGSLDVVESTFKSNRAAHVTAGATATGARGGAIAAVNTVLNVVRSTFHENNANAGTMGSGATQATPGLGGAVFVSGGTTATLTNSTFSHNRVWGSRTLSSAYSSGNGFGGAIAIEAGATVTLVHNTLADNAANKGDHPPGGPVGVGAGGAIYSDSADVRLTNNLIVNNTATTRHADVSASVALITGGGNLITSAAGVMGLSDDENKDRLGSPERPLTVTLAGLSDSAGHTQVRLPDSGVADRGVPLPGGPGHDQRGHWRDVTPDPGAVELQGNPYAGYGNALRLDGVDDTVVIPRTRVLENNALMIEAWFKLSPDAGTRNVIYSYGSASGRQPVALEYLTDNGGRFRFTLRRADGTAIVDAFAPLPLAQVQNQWVRVMARWAQGIATVYVNQKQLVHVMASGTIGYGDDGQGYIGSAFGAGGFFKGDLDEVRLWNFPSSSAIYDDLPQDDHYDWVSSFGFDERGGTTAMDLRRARSHATLVGMTEAARVPSTVPVRIAAYEDDTNPVWMRLPIVHLDAPLTPTSADFRVVTPPSHGTVTISGSGRMDYDQVPHYNGTDTFTYAIMTPAGLSAPVPVTINIAPIEDYPYITSTAPTGAFHGQPYTYHITAIDNDGEPLTITAVNKPAWLTFVDHGDGTATLSGVPSTADGGAHAIRIRAVADGEDWEQTFTITVYTVNQVPRFTSWAPAAAKAYKAYTHGVSAVDDDGNPLTLSIVGDLPGWLTFTDHGNGTGTFTGTPTNAYAGANPVVLRVADGTTTVDQTLNFTVNANAAPRFLTTSYPVATGGKPYTAAVSLGDNEYDPLTFTVVSLPAWLTLAKLSDTYYELRGTPSNTDVAGDNRMVLRLSDGYTTVEQNVAITVQRSNVLPTVVSNSVTTAWAGVPYQSTLTVTDKDGDPVTIKAFSLPAWMTLTDNGNNTATLRGTPTHTSAGSVWVYFDLLDGYGGVQRAVQLQLAINAAPAFTTAPPTPPRLNAGESFSHTFAASDGNGHALSFAIAGTSPQWLTLTDHGNGTATLSGTAELGSWVSGSVVVSASDGMSTVEQVVFLSVNRPPQFVTTFLPGATAEQAYAYFLYAQDADLDGLTMTALSLPAWLSLEEAGPGAWRLVGTPINADAASDDAVVLRLGDGMIDVEQTITVPVTRVNHAPVFTSPAPETTAYFDTRYTYALSTADADGDALTITATGLPHWLTLVDHGDGTATLSGVPTDSLASSHAITLRVGDGEALTEQSFILSVPMERFRLDEHGTLFVMGGVGRDVIQVWVREGNQVRAVVNGVIRNYPLASVTGLTIYGLDENDSISVNTRSIAAYVLGGGGNDTLVGGEQRDTFIGGGGHDRLYGDAGDDRLSGLGGNDYLEGGGGNDYLSGGDGHDYLVGNGGNDRLYGDAGDDVLHARDSAYDILLGGDGDDQASYDPQDLRHDLFTTPA